MRYIWSISCFLFPVVLLGQPGIVWSELISIAGAMSGNDHPRMTTNASGHPLVIWHNASRLMYSHGNESGFEVPRMLNPAGITVAGANWMGPDIASQGDTVYVVYKQTPEDIGHIWLMRSFDGGMTFDEPVQVDNIENSLSRFPTVAVDDAGHPVVGFMKFNLSFGNARWVVTRSYDHGESFTTDVLASGWSGPNSEVCDCCPGAIVASGDHVAMLYRDNNNNIRDTWSGFSSDGGLSFDAGENIDQLNWIIHACPASGPDGVIIGDTVYSAFMSGAGGMSRVYANRTALTDIQSEPGKLLQGDIPGLQQQNFPAISASGNALGIIWRQTVSGQDQCVILFTADITGDQPPVYDTVGIGSVVNADIAMWGDKIYVVWEDNSTGTVRFRSGTFLATTSADNEVRNELIAIHPNPSHDSWFVSGAGLIPGMRIEVVDVTGRLLHTRIIHHHETGDMHEITLSSGSAGVYFVRFMLGNFGVTRKVMMY